MTAFERYHLELAALSKDTPAEVAKHRARDEIPFVLLSDPKLAVIRQFGLEHHKALEFTTFTLFGIPLGLPSGYKTMAIPTTLIVDEQGIVRWIDQADDYRIRGDAGRIEKALEDVFGAQPATS